MRTYPPHPITAAREMASKQFWYQNDGCWKRKYTRWRSADSTTLRIDWERHWQLSHRSTSSELSCHSASACGHVLLPKESLLNVNSHELSFIHFNQTYRVIISTVFFIWKFYKKNFQLITHKNSNLQVWEKWSFEVTFYTIGHYFIEISWIEMHISENFEDRR